MKLAPIALFAYKRLDCLEKTVTALRQNILATKSDLYIFSDGARSEDDREKVIKVREYIRQVSGFKSVECIESKVNLGLAKSIRKGVDFVFRSKDTIIVLEDDLETSTNFLSYMNQALDYYKEQERIFSIGAFTMPVDVPPLYGSDVYLTKRAGSWGWATWRKRWSAVDWNLLLSDHVLDLASTKQMGTDFPNLIRKYRHNVIDSWAVPWSYYAFKNNLLCVYPTKSKVRNIGFGRDATHTSLLQKRYETIIDSGENIDFRFLNAIEEDSYLSRQFLSNFSYYQRVKWKILKSLNHFATS